MDLEVALRGAYSASTFVCCSFCVLCSCRYLFVTRPDSGAESAVFTIIRTVHTPVSQARIPSCRGGVGFLHLTSRSFLLLRVVPGFVSCWACQPASNVVPFAAFRCILRYGTKTEKTCKLPDIAPGRNVTVGCQPNPRAYVDDIKPRLWTEA
ncbi:hypothetical protein BC834DRAFT_447043 [Gloeopeniophorella convolvens]|nr:hypothetical protein BC834DRAFT_447043 [Gloeopeniophorella convolvens]